MTASADAQLSRIECNVASELAGYAEAEGSRAAFVVVGEDGTETRRITFAQLHEDVARCAGGLRSRGVEPGDRVVVFVPMSPQLYVLMLAILRLGAVAVFIDPWGGRRMIDAAVKLVDARGFVGVPKAHALRIFSRALRGVPVRVAVAVSDDVRVARLVPGAIAFDRLLAGTTGDLRVYATHPVAADDPALITFTTGTTGLPKGANRTHGLLLAQHRTLGRHLDQRRGDIHLTNLPIFVLHNLGCGVTTVLPPAALAQDPEPDGAWLRAVLKENGVTVLAASPALVDALARSSSRDSLPLVTRLYTGGGPVLPGLLERVAPLLPNAATMVLYGSTESEPIAHCTGAEVLARRSGVRAHGGIYVGTVVDEIDLLLLAPVSGAVELAEGERLADRQVAPGAPGEVVVAGDHVNRDYYRNETAFRENKIVDELGRVWHRTGDMARLDVNDGGLWLLGRLAGGFDLNGRRHYPLELETALGDLPQLARAAVCIVGDKPVVAIEPSAGTEPDTALAASAAHLGARGMAGALRLQVLDRIPVDRRHATKIDMARLRARLKP